MHIYTILIRIGPQQWPYTVFTKAKITGLWGDNKPLCSPWGCFPENIREWYTTGCLWRMHRDYCLQLLLSHLLIYWNITSCWRLNIEHVFSFFWLSCTFILASTKCWSMPGLVPPASYFLRILWVTSANFTDAVRLYRFYSAREFCSSSSLCELFP